MNILTVVSPGLLHLKGSVAVEREYFMKSDGLRAALLVPARLFDCLIMRVDELRDCPEGDSKIFYEGYSEHDWHTEMSLKSNLIRAMITEIGEHDPSQGSRVIGFEVKVKYLRDEQEIGGVCLCYSLEGVMIMDTRTARGKPSLD